jgi:hypothetical protein
LKSVNDEKKDPEYNLNDRDPNVIKENKKIASGHLRSKGTLNMGLIRGRKGPQGGTSMP